MYACRIDRMHLFHSRHLLLHRTACQFMNQFPERGILLRRASYNSEREDRPLFRINLMHLHHRERMGQAVVAQMVAKRPLRPGLAGMNLARNHEIGVTAHTKAVHIAVPEVAARQQPGEGHLA
ncbi:hypothetical protein D3C74_431320 [compost metagenome]